jgi:hypothetical protein
MCLFPFDLHSAAVFDSHLPMPCSDHAVLLKATAQHGRRETACGLPARVRLLPATMRTFTKDTELSEQGRGAAWRCELTHGMAGGTVWARHGHGMLCVNPP